MNNNLPTILITGANGFLGFHVMKAFEQSKQTQYNITSPNSETLNLLDYKSLCKYIKQSNTTTILHMAGVCAGIKGNANNPGRFLYTNTQMALNVYEGARTCGVKRVYGLGTVCMYPKFCPVPFKEDYILGEFPKSFQTVGNYPEETNAPYSYGKRILMMMGKTYREQYDIKGAFLIPVNMYGEEDHFDLINSHVVPALIRKFEDAKTNNIKEVEVWGTENSGTSREFLYSGDCAEIIVKTVLSDFDNPLPINIGTGQEIKIVDLVKLIKELVGYQGNVLFNGKLDGQPRRCLDISRAKNLLNWSASTSLRDGLIKTIDWYRANKTNII
jgi:GDP-L-fucose synthase